MDFKIFLKLSKIQYHIVNVYTEWLFCVADFHICTALYDGVLPTLAVTSYILVTVECFCDCDEVWS